MDCLGVLNASVCRHFDHRRGIGMHTYLVDVRISGDWATEEDVSGALGLRASQFARKGETKYGRILDRSVWQLDSRPSADTLEWQSLEEGLTQLVQRLMPLKEALRALQPCDVRIVCGHFTSSFGGGPTLSPSILRLLAELGIQVTISNYFGSENETTCSLAQSL